jgi:hypothetical protein
VNDPIRFPQHYAFSEYEPIKVIRAWGLSFALGNVVKYICRNGRKGDRLEDLKKAMTYLEDEIAAIEQERARKAAEKEKA